MQTAESDRFKPGSCRSVLIVEDDDGIRDALRFSLELEDYQVFVASNGKEGLELLPKIPAPCLILLDLMMPVMSGWEFAAALEKDMVLATIPVVLVTAYADEAKTVKAKGIIKKPVDLDVLLASVKRWCALSDTSRDAA